MFRFTLLGACFLCFLSSCGRLSSTDSARYNQLIRQYRAIEKRSDPKANETSDTVMDSSKPLDLRTLIDAAWRKNAGLVAGRLAWRHALHGVRRSGEYPDTMLSYSFAPQSIGHKTAPYGQVIELSQPLVYPNKIESRRSGALWEAQGRYHDFRVQKLELALVATQLWADYYGAERSLEINQRHLDLVEQMKRSAVAQYATGRASQQDPLQADVTVGHLLHERHELIAQRQRVVTQINGLLNQDPQTTLPPPPKQLSSISIPATQAQLVEKALGQRPELSANAAMKQSRQAAVQSAKLSYVPDVSVMGAYDSTMMDEAHRFMLGLSVALPLQTEGRRAEIAQSKVDLDRLNAERKQMQSDIAVQVAQAYIGLKETVEIVDLYDKRVLPAARQQLNAAQSGFVTGQNDFVALIEAERNLRQAELQTELARAQQYRKWAELLRATGESVLEDHK